jgi:hypothetical protein
MDQGVYRMTDLEFPKWLSSAFVAFPDLLEWVDGLPDKQGTMSAWRKTLAPFSMAECALVLDWWIEGRVPAPKAFERSHTALLVRSAIEHKRALDRREQLKSDGREFVNNSSMAKKQRDQYEPLPGRPNTAGMGEEAYLLRMEMVAGKITLEELQEKLREKRAERLDGRV